MHQYPRGGTVQYCTVLICGGCAFSSISTFRLNQTLFVKNSTSTVQYITVHCSTVQYCTVQTRTVQYITVQCKGLHYSTVQCSTVQYCTVPTRTDVLYSTVRPGLPAYTRLQVRVHTSTRYTYTIHTRLIVATYTRHETRNYSIRHDSLGDISRYAFPLIFRDARLQSVFYNLAF